MAASLLPNSAFLISLFFGNKKRRGSLFLRAYPRSQALALPLLKDKQRKPAHAEWHYIIRHRHCYQQNTLIARNKPGYNTPTRTLRCITSVRRFKFARFDYTDSNVQKTSFPFGCPDKRCIQPQDSIDVCCDPPSLAIIDHCCPPMTRTGFVGCKSTKKNNTPVFLLTIIIKKIISFNKI